MHTHTLSYMLFDMNIKIPAKKFKILKFFLYSDTIITQNADFFTLFS